MKNKLTIEQLAPYLPYELKFVFDNKEYWSDAGLTYTGERYDLGELIRLTTSTENVIGIKWNDEKNGLSAFAGLDSKFHKPILRPLSDLPKYNERFEESWITRMNKECINACNVSGVWLDSDLDFDLTFDRSEPPTYLSFEYTNKCREWIVKHHFDVSGLIAAGLAVDINTIEHA